MKKLLLFFIFLSNYTFAQSYTWATTDSAYQSDYGARTCLAKDTSGNLFVAYAPLTSWGSASALYIIKYDINHAIVWKQTIAAVGIGHGGIGMCTDVLGNVYVTSKFSGDLFVGSTMCAVGGGNMFLLKLNFQGMFQWVQRTTGGQTFGLSVSSDAQNNIYVAGGINGDSYFESTHLTSQTSYSFPYIAKYSTNGNLLWVKGFSAGTSPRIKTDAAGNTYMAGQFNYTAHFDSISITANGTSSYGSTDIYIAKIDSSGNWLWVIHSGGVDQEEVADFAIDSQSNLYVTGYSESPTATYGAITVTNTVGDNYFAAKYDSNGNALWATGGGGPNGFGYGICADNQGNAYLSRTGSFISKYDNSGNFLWTQYKPTAANLDMLADDSGRVYIAGYFQNNVSFDNFTFIASQINSNQMFLAELYNPPEITTSINEPKHCTTDFSVFPNPTSRIITVNITTTKPKEDFILKVSNSLGKNVYCEGLENISGSYSKQIDLGKLPKGIYFIELQSSAIDYMQKKADVKKIVLQ